MRIEIFIFLATAFFIYNSYHDGKYTKMLVSYKKYYQMAFYVVLGLGVYLTLKRSPTQGKNMLVCANNVVKYMPIDKSSLEMLSPIFDLTGSGFMDEGPRFARGGGMGQNAMGGGQMHRLRQFLSDMAQRRSCLCASLFSRPSKPVPRPGLAQNSRGSD